ncbi:Methionine--tRNA ligase [Planctomycetes bacterium Pan216]|uniref:Methionine--tRNA ligase n=1 Tax=Kolteria novifilia TaxID=2527975 RepID=A0A518B534_9BACT|nr:Methionine--tRNA ligase [Planctomycetes bacterium Pan216]
MTRRFLITGALPYSNGRLHVGHIAGAYLPADIYVRYLRSRGDDVLFVCGSDDNGVAITLSAQKEGLTPPEIVAKYNASQQRAFEGLGIDFDVFGGTHTPDYVERHTELSQEFFKSIYDKGYFTKRTTSQLYDVQADRFLPDRYVTGTCYLCGAEGAYGDQCEACGHSMDPLKLKDPKSVFSGTTPEVRETTHWYLRLDEFQEPLAQWLEEREGWRPTVLNFAKGQIKLGLPERAMTRDLDWGIPVPLDDPDAAGKVLYVWFDAPIGYVSFSSTLLERQGGSPSDYEEWWKSPDCKIVHFIGEDNIVFHAIIWPAMLMAEGTYQLPHQVVANSFLNIKFPGKDEEKISKSRGTAVWIEDYLTEFDPDPLRYYLTAIAPENARTAYDPDEFLVRNDSELLATLGNFVNRNITFAHKYFDGKVPEVGARSEVDEKLLRLCGEQAEKVAEQLEGFHFKAGLTEVMALARAGNLYLDEKKPWSQRKEDLAACGTTINVCLQVVRALMVLMQPFLPFSARKCLEMLQLDESALQWDQATTELPAGTALADPTMLFKKLQEQEKK